MAGKPSGSIRAKGKGFQARIQVGGERRERIFKTEAEAEDWLTTIRSDAIRDVFTGLMPIRFDRLARKYAAHKHSRWRQGMRDFFKAHIEPCLEVFGHRMAGEIRARDLQEFLDDQLAKGYAPMTVNKRFQVLHQAFEWGVGMDYLLKNPMRGVEKARVKHVEKRVLRLHEVAAILKAAGPRDYPYFVTLFYAGLRKGEMSRMTWDWVDFEQRMLHIKVAKRGSNVIPMADPIRKALAGLGVRDGLVFPSRVDGQIWDKRKAIKRVCEAAEVDLDGVTLHTFRHSFITAVEEVASYSVVRALARHGSAGGDVTARYLHPSTRRQREALEEIQKKVESAGSKLAILGQSGSRGTS